MIQIAMLAVPHATGRASHARQVKGDDPDKNGYPGPPGLGFGVGLTTPHSKKHIVTKVEQREKLDRFKDDGESFCQIGKNGRILVSKNPNKMTQYSTLLFPQVALHISGISHAHHHELYCSAN
jgi:hypothetical protein